MNSIAENHLSQYGRFGDTEMYQTSKSGPGEGDLWHVNPAEKKLMMESGLKGEKLIDALGSGTINPVTGKEEKFITMAAIGTIAAIGSAAVGAYQSYKESSMDQESAKTQLEQIQQGKDDLDEAKILNQQLRSNQVEAAKLEGKQAVERQQASNKISLATGEQDIADIQQKTGLITGTAARKAKQSRDITRDKASENMKDLEQTLGKSLASINEGFAAESARIESEKQKLTQAEELAEAKQGQWYLGKNIKEAFAGDKGKLGSALAYGTLGLTGGPAGMIAGATYGYQKELT